jgi:tetratricopeptide (TPR) repeat protein
LELSDAQALLKRGIAAAHAGHVELARFYLAKATKLNPDNEHSWFWLSSVLDKPEQAQYCLKQVLAINPYNERARTCLMNLTKRQKSTLVKPSLQLSISARTCPVCGAERRSGAQLCSQCGTPLLAQAIADDTLEKVLRLPLRQQFKPTRPLMGILFIPDQRPARAGCFLIVGMVVLVALCLAIYLSLSLLR